MTFSDTEAEEVGFSRRYGAAGLRLRAACEAIHPALAEYLASEEPGTRSSGLSDRRRRQAMRVAALAALGCCGEELTRETEAALAGGLAPAEIVEVVIHTIPYAGIPRPLNTLIAVKDLFDERGLLPVVLDEPDWGPDERTAVGTDRIAQAHPTAAPALAENLAPIAPGVYRYIVGAAFGDIYGRPGLTYQQRQPITVVTLVALGNVANHLHTHVGGALTLGIPPLTVAAAMVDVLSIVDPSQVLTGLDIVRDVCAQREVPAGNPAALPTW